LTDDEAIPKRDSSLYARNKLRNLVADTPSPGGREIEGGGISPSPLPSPVKGEGISAGNDNKKGAMTGKEGLAMTIAKTSQ